MAVRHNNDIAWILDLLENFPTIYICSWLNLLHSNFQHTESKYLACFPECKADGLKRVYTVLTEYTCLSEAIWAHLYMCFFFSMSILVLWCHKNSPVNFPLQYVVTPVSQSPKLCHSTHKLVPSIYKPHDKVCHSNTPILQHQFFCISYLSQH